MIKKILVALLLTLLLNVAVTVFEIYKKGSIHPQFCADMICSGDYVYSIDMGTNYDVKIFRCRKNGTQAVAIEDTTSSDYELCYNYTHLTCDSGTGEVYLYRLESDAQTGLPTKEEIIHCNFEEQKLETVYEITPPFPEAEMPYVINFQVKNDVLNYLVETEDGYAVYTQKDNTAVKVRDIAMCDDAIFYTMNFDGRGKITAFSNASGLYYEDKNNILQAVTGENGEWAAYTEPVLGEDMISCIDVSVNQQIVYFLKTGKIRTHIVPPIYRVTNAQEAGSRPSIKRDELINQCYSSEYDFIAYAELPYTEELITNENSDYDSLPNTDFHYAIAVYQDGEMNLYSDISYDTEYLKERGWNIFFNRELKLLIILLISFVLYAVIQKTGFVSLRFQIGIVSMVVFGIIIQVLIVVVSLVMIINYQMNYQAMLSTLEKDMTKELDILIQNTPDFEKETMYSKEFYENLTSLPDSSVFLNEVTGNEELGIYYLLHVLDENGEFQIVYNGDGMERVPSSVWYHNFYTDQIYENILQTHRSRMGIQYDTTGQWYVDNFYYENTQYNFKAIVEIGIDYYKVALKCSLFQSDILGLIIICCLVLLIVIQIYLGINLSPIKKLGLQVEKGNVEKPYSRHLASEILVVWERLYVMINNAWQRQREEEKNNQQHYSFISSELVSLLNLENLSEVEVGKQRQCNLHILYVVFQQPVPEKMQMIYKKLTQVIAGQGGILLHLHMDRVVWLFQRSDKEIFRNANEVLKTAARYGVQCGVGIGSGINTIAVSGAEEYAEINIFGSEYDAAKQLAEKAAKKGGLCFLTYNAKTLVSPDYWNIEEISSEDTENTWFSLFPRAREFSSKPQKTAENLVGQT